VRRPGPSTPGVFHCMGETAILAICSGIFVLFAIMAFRSDSAEYTLYFLGFSALGIVGLLARKTKVMAGSDSIQIYYPLWKRTISYWDITKVSILSTYNDDEGTPGAEVQVERRTGSTLRFNAIKEGSIALYDAIEAARKQIA
jgi:hypothetical protein